MKSLRAYLLAAVTATAIVAALPGAVAAAQPDGAYARFNFDGGKGGLVFLSYAGATTVNAGVLGLVSSAEYFLHGSSQNCSHTPNSGNKVFRVNGMTDANGVLWMRRSPTIGATVHSIWLGSNDALGAAVCAISFNFEKYKTNAVGDWDGDAILGIWDKEHVLSLLVRKPNDQARLDVVINTGSGDDEVNLRGVDRRCGRRPTQRFFDIPAELSVTGTFQTEMLAMTSNEMGMIRSERVIYDSGHHGCANIIAILIG